MPMPLALLIFTGFIRGFATIKRMGAMPEVNKLTILSSVIDKQKGLMEFVHAVQSQKHHYNLPSQSTNQFMPSDARTDFRNYNKFKS